MDPIWEKIYSTREWGKYPAEDLIRTVFRTFKKDGNISKLKVLEIGCGAGANLSFFLNEGFQVYGIDGAPSAIKCAYERLIGLKKEGQTFDIRVQDFTAIPWSEATFDIVVDYISICTNKYQEIEKTINECHRVLKPGGYMYSRCWDRECTGANTGNIIEPGTSDGPTSGPCVNSGTSHFFTEEECCSLYSKFSDIQMRRSVVENYHNDERICEWLIWAKK